jgi:hypothetical protein
MTGLPTRWVLIGVLVVGLGLVVAFLMLLAALGT